MKSSISLVTFNIASVFCYTLLICNISQAMIGQIYSRIQMNCFDQPRHFCLANLQSCRMNRADDSFDLQYLLVLFAGRGRYSYDEWISFHVTPVLFDFSRQDPAQFAAGDARRAGQLTFAELSRIYYARCNMFDLRSYYA